jgi:hypothetical protein
MFPLELYVRHAKIDRSRQPFVGYVSFLQHKSLIRFSICSLYDRTLSDWHLRTYRTTAQHFQEVCHFKTYNSLAT